MKHLLNTILLLLLPLQAIATPRLTLFVMVDGLDGASMAEQRAFWSQGGLRTLQEEAMQTQVSFPHLVWGGDETTATIVTGQTPAYHGYATDLYFQRSDRMAHHRLEQSDARGINTHLQISPAGLASSTLSDAFRLQHGPQSKIYAIGLEPATTVLLAGHAANACCWLESAMAGWCTTAFYSGGLPAEAVTMNASGRLEQLAETPWTNRLEINSYLHPTAEEKKKEGFSYDIRQNLRHSAIGNTLVTDLALAIQKGQHMGEDITPDLLLLEYTVRSPKATGRHIQSAEQEDLYIRLNQDLGYLIEQLDKRIGRENLQIVLVGRPLVGTSRDDYQAAALPTGSFNIDRAAALAGTYLMAMHGHERWIDGGYGNSIYLNRRLIEQKKMSLSTLQRQVADFISEMSGVRAAWPAEAIPMLAGEGETAKLRNSVTRTDGDIIIELQEGWVLYNSEQQAADQVIDREPLVPFFIWSGALQTYPNLPNPLPATAIRSLLDK